jgi:serine/threonine protein kinase
MKAGSPCGTIMSYKLARLKPGDLLVGKWKGVTYRIERTLGEGANGSVYLARSLFGSSPCVFALKIGHDMYALQSEMNALKALLDLHRQSGSGNGSGQAIFPRIYETDDCEMEAGIYPFYTMTFVSGIPLREHVKTQGNKVLLRCGRSLLESLRQLHACGWAFGDLKSGNVLAGPAGEAQLIDFGGTTKYGDAVRQYTELYDRGYWRCGERTSEAAYDLFSFAILMLEASGAEARLKSLARQSNRRNMAALLALADDSIELNSVAPCLKRMIRGEYFSIDAALADWDNGLKLPAANRSGTIAEWTLWWFAASAASFAASLWWIAAK